MMRSTDAPALVCYRNDPQVAKHQLWSLPFTIDQARQMLANQDDPAADLSVGGAYQLAIERDGTVIGDVFTSIDATGGVAEIGFTLLADEQGNGYATEAAAAVVEAMFEKIGVGRVYGELDPANVASQRTLERLGLVFEAHTKASFLWRGEWTDNLSYAATGDDYTRWRDRPRHRPTAIRLIELDHANHRRYAALRTHYSQRGFVASVEQSFGDALYPPPGNDGAPFRPWLRGIEADGEPVGFVMTTEPTASDPEPYLWRLLIDRLHQRRGIGSAVVDQLCSDWATAGVDSAIVTWIEGPGSPAPMYTALGFVPTGELDGEEIVARRVLRRVPAE